MQLLWGHNIGSLVPLCGVQRYDVRAPAVRLEGGLLVGGAGVGGGATLSVEAAAAAAARGRLLTVEEAQLLHVTHMHKGYYSSSMRALTEALGVRVPPDMPTCDVCDLNRARKLPFKS